MKTVSNIRLYNALKPHVGEEAAEMIAEVIPPADQLVTKQDLDVGLSSVKADLLKWMIALMVPTWVGTYGVIAAIVLKG